MSSVQKEVYYGSEARKKLKEGIDFSANAVKVTLGPKGRNVILHREHGTQYITKDGVTVAKDMMAKDPIVDMGCRLIRDVASKTNDEAGDGTTTATVLSQAILNEGMKLVEAGCDPIELQKGIKAATGAVVNYIKENMSTPVDDDFNAIKKIATVSANGDEYIGSLIAEAMQKVTTKGVITVDFAKGTETEIEYTEGIKIDRGFSSPYFITDQSKSECILDNPKILVTDFKMGTSKDLVPMLEAVVGSNSPLLIFADTVDGELLSTLIINRMRQTMKVCVVKAPSYGDNRVEILKDIAAMTGATFVDSKYNKLSEITIDALGTCDKAIIKHNETVLIGADFDADAVKDRLEVIDSIINDTKGVDHDTLVERRAQLQGGVAVLRVGGGSEIERKEMRDRVDDALAATKAAIEMGYVPGGGVALVRAGEAIKVNKDKNLEGVSEDAVRGWDLITKITKAPLTAICKNAGISGDVVIANLLNQESRTYGFDVRQSVWGDMIELGIIDPTKVTINALLNAVSIVSTVLTTECLVYTVPESTKNAD